LHLEAVVNVAMMGDDFLVDSRSIDDLRRWWLSDSWSWGGGDGGG